MSSTFREGDKVRIVDDTTNAVYEIVSIIRPYNRLDKPFTIRHENQQFHFHAYELTPA